MLENILCMEIKFPPIILQSCIFSVFCNFIYLLVLAWQSIIKLKIKHNSFDSFPL